MSNFLSPIEVSLVILPPSPLDRLNLRDRDRCRIIHKPKKRALGTERRVSERLSDLEPCDNFYDIIVGHAR